MSSDSVSPSAPRVRTHPLFGAALAFALGLTALAAIAYGLDLFYYSVHGGDFGLVFERRLQESAYLAAPLLGYLGFWAALTGLSLWLLATDRFRGVFPYLVALPAFGLVFWSFARVTVYYYMRIEPTLELALYTLLELRQLIGSELVQATSAAPVSIPLWFGALAVACFAWPWAFRRSLLPLLARRDVSESDAASEGGAPLQRSDAGVFALLALVMLAGPIASQALATRAASGEVEERGRAKISMIRVNAPDEFPGFDLTPPLYACRPHFQERFGFTLPKETNIVFIILESARHAFVELERTKYFAPSPETLSVRHFFAPVPHSSNSHFSLYTGLHSRRDFEATYKEMRPEITLPLLLERREGFVNYFIYTDHTAFEDEDKMLARLNMRITEKHDFVRRVNPETNQPYKQFHFGLDDIALLHEALNVAETETAPYTLTLVQTNSHYPYFNPHPEEFNRFDNATLVGRHRNGVDYGLHIADRVVEEFEKRGLAEKTLFVLLSDHGESFGEHGYYRHSFSIYNEEVKVPLVLRHPELRKLPVREIEKGTMLDVFPTVFDMTGRCYPEPLHGRSIFAPDYDFNMPLWVWRLDDYRGLLYEDVKWLYNDQKERLITLDLNDRLLKEWTMDEHARRFVAAMKAQDFGRPTGLAAATGTKPGPVPEWAKAVYAAREQEVPEKMEADLPRDPARWILPPGPVRGGANFHSGGGSFLAENDEDD